MKQSIMNYVCSSTMCIRTTTTALQHKFRRRRRMLISSILLETVSRVHESLCFDDINPSDKHFMPVCQAMGKIDREEGVSEPSHGE